MSAAGLIKLSCYTTLTSVFVLPRSHMQAYELVRQDACRLLLGREDAVADIFSFLFYSKVLHLLVGIWSLGSGQCNALFSHATTNKHGNTVYSIYGTLHGFFLHVIK